MSVPPQRALGLDSLRLRPAQCVMPAGAQQRSIVGHHAEVLSTTAEVAAVVAAVMIGFALLPFRPIVLVDHQRPHGAPLHLATAEEQEIDHDEPPRVTIASARDNPVPTRLSLDCPSGGVPAAAGVAVVVSFA